MMVVGEGALGRCLSLDEVMRVVLHEGIGALTRRGSGRSILSPGANTKERPCEHPARRQLSKS